MSTTLRCGVTTWSVQSAKPNQGYGILAQLPLQQGTQQAQFRVGVDKIPTRATIVKAELQFHHHAAQNGTFTLHVSYNTSRWPAAVTWATRPTASNPVGMATLTNPKANQVYRVDVTSAVQSLVSRARPGYGWRLATPTATAFKVRGSKAAAGAPVLVVTYTVTPLAPSGLEPSAAGIGVGKPVLTFDADDAITGLQVQIDPAGNGTSPQFDSGIVPVTGGMLDLNDTSYPGLAQGSLTFWRVRQRTDGGWSPWSGWVSFTRLARPVLTITSPPRTYLTNLAVTPSVEVATTNWVGGAVTTDRAWSGARSYRMDGTTSSAINIPALAANTTYTASGWAYIPAAVTGTIQARIGGAGVAAAVLGPAVTERDQWVRTSVTFTTSAAGGNVAFHPAFGGTGSRDVDAVLVTTGSELVDYFDGDMPNADWTGTPHNSTSTRSRPTPVADGTPPITWTLDEDQTAWRVRLFAENGDVIADSGRKAGTDTTWTPNKGLSRDGQIGTIQVEAWDNTDRISSPGDPEQSIATVDITLATDATIGLFTNVTATDSAIEPVVTVAGSRSAIPDQIALTRDGKQVGLFTGGQVCVPAPGGGFRCTVRDSTAVMSRPQRWRMVPIVNGKRGGGGTGVQLIPHTSGIWLTDADARRVVILTGDEQDQSQEENAVVHQPLPEGNNPVRHAVRRRLVRAAPSGTIAGELADVPTRGWDALAMEAILRDWIDDDAGEWYTLHLGGYTGWVILGDITISEVNSHPSEGRRVAVSLSWWEADS